MDRDRVVSNTWYDQEKNRWEMDPMAVPYAVSKKLIEYARIRHNWGAMYVALRGEEKETYVDIKVITLCVSYGKIFLFHFLFYDYQ